MPVWGNRMVCETANYKHMEEKRKEFLDRENSLAKWMKEKTERKQRLQNLNDRIRQGSICSTGSQLREGSVDLDSYDEGFGSPTNSTAPATPKTPGPTTITTTPMTSQPRRGSAPIGGTNSRPSSATTSATSGFRSGSLGSSFDGGDRAHIVGGGRQFDHPCGNCSIM